ncbi:Protein Wnt-6 [Homalodisca vitripennis]|nr:Protein Wnt-6 [Homalodisca vitripennis]
MSHEAVFDSQLFIGWGVEESRAVTLFQGVGNQVVMDPTMICKKTRRLRGRMADICKHEPALLKEITKGVQLGTRECQFQFRNRRWNCTSARRSLKKVLMREQAVLLGNSQQYRIPLWTLVAM